MTGQHAAAPGAFVTGGARGLGRSIVHRLARRGDTVFLADLDLEAAQAAARELVDQGLDVRALHLDVADVESTLRIVTEADDQVPLDTLVNNAGIGPSAPLLSVTPEDYDRVMAVNLRGVYFALQAVARRMVARRRGSIVNICSTSGFTASTSPMTLYDTSKGAVRMLTVTAARELAPHGVRVNAVAPGTVETELTRSLADPAALQRLVEQRIPLGHLGQPDDIAAAVDFLSSGDAAYVTGHTLVVDGGWLT